MKTHNSFSIHYSKIFLFMLFTLSVSITAIAEENAAVCISALDQKDPLICDVGNGKTIIVWKDYRSQEEQTDIYAQMVTVNGKMLWQENGVAICTHPETQYTPKIVSDGAGGAIIAWLDLRNGNYDLFAQRVDSTGKILWPENGIAVCTNEEYQGIIDMISDDDGGAIFAWEDKRIHLTHSNVFAHRINSNGEAVWTENGVAVCDTSINLQPKLVSDGSHGAIVTWADGRSPSIETNYDIYAQHIDNSGNRKWLWDGVAVTRATSGQMYPEIVSDVSGGAIIIWKDFRGSNGVYAQRVNSSGSRVWANEDIYISDAANEGLYKIVADESGGAFIIWRDQTLSGNGSRDIYGQHLNSNGTYLWGDSGYAVCNQPDDQNSPQLTSDGEGGIFVTWYDDRNHENT